MSDTILVVGGGISGLTAAVEAAEAGADVVLVERQPWLGGRVAQVSQYFPKLCPPACGLEINLQRLAKNPRLRVITQAEVAAIAGQAGDFAVTLQIQPRLISAACTACGRCAQACPARRPDAFNLGLAETPAAYRPHPHAFPQRYAIDPAACRGAACAACVAVCPAGAIDLAAGPATASLKVGAIVWATGWSPYPVQKLGYYGGGRYANAINNLALERLAAPDGPTGGQILRPSDGKPPRSIAFVQCAGSRDVSHLQACAGVCCLAALKQAAYARARLPDARLAFFYIDVRAPGVYEDFYAQVRDEMNVAFIKGKPGQISEDPATANLTVLAEDQLSGCVIEEEFDLVVLAAGIAPATRADRLPAAASYDADGFITAAPPGVFAAGCVKRPMPVASAVQDATAAAMRALAALKGCRCHA